MAEDVKPYFRNPIQIGLIVDDLEGTLENLEKIFGIGPFRIVDFPPKGEENIKMMYHGRDAKFRAKFCFFDFGKYRVRDHTAAGGGYDLAGFYPGRKDLGCTISSSASPHMRALGSICLGRGSRSARWVPLWARTRARSGCSTIPMS